MLNLRLLLPFAWLLYGRVEGHAGYVALTHDGPVVQGATITFRAELFNYDGTQPSGSFRFTWSDDPIPQHQHVSETKEPRSTWQVTYPPKFYYPGVYKVQVKVDKWQWWGYGEFAWKETTFNVTDLLNGQMDLIQSNRTLTGVYVSNNESLHFAVSLSEPDLQFLTTNATFITTYWFKDCVYYGQTDDFTFNYTFREVGENHMMEALTVASYDPITTTAPPSTTTIPPSTTPSTLPNTTVTSATTSTVSLVPSRPTLDMSQVSFNHALGTNEVGGSVLSDQLPTNKSISVPYICSNSSIVPPDPKKTYGYFHRSFSVKAPVQNISISGTNWLQQSEVLNLNVYCNGSTEFRYCYYKEVAGYIATGNETCTITEIVLDSCQFPVTMFYTHSNYTMVVIISNDVSKVVYPVSVIVYKVEKHAQLSVIVVPVACSMVAVILIVFGVAYYLQSRKRFTVEVADFDFGQTGGEMEYKTFRERLTEAVVNSFNRDFGMDGENVWSPSRKYGSMQ